MLPAVSVSTLLIRSAASVWHDQRSVTKVPQLSVAQVSRQRRLCDKHQALYPKHAACRLRQHFVTHAPQRLYGLTGFRTQYRKAK